MYLVQIRVYVAAISASSRQWWNNEDADVRRQIELYRVFFYWVIGGKCNKTRNFEYFSKPSGEVNARYMCVIKNSITISKTTNNDIYRSMFLNVVFHHVANSMLPFKVSTINFNALFNPFCHRFAHSFKQVGVIMNYRHLSRDSSFKLVD